jgi:beta-glucosidase
MSDWTSTYDAAGAANGGLDLEMPTGKLMNRESLVAAVKSGAVRLAGSGTERQLNLSSR